MLTIERNARIGGGGGQTVANPGHKEAKSSIPAVGEGERGRAREGM